MLKWTVMARRDVQQRRASCDLGSLHDKAATSTTPRKKRRRSSTHRRRSSLRDSLEADKENQFTSTPIKSSEGLMQFDVLRDVSNLTPTDNSRRVLSTKKCKSEKKSPHHRPLKKKKTCLNPHKPVESCSNYFTPFESVDSHIKGIAMDEKIADEDPPNKKQKIDFFLTSPEAKPFKFPNLKSSAKKLEIKVSPLVRKFIDLRFSKISFESKENRNNNLHENSSYINDLSLDQLVDAILETSSEESVEPKTSTKLSEFELEKENNLNETHEENLINTENERILFDSSSTDSGFRSSTTENSHQLDSNYVCKCNNNNKDVNLSGNIVCDKTIINMNETFNERCVDDDLTCRKRASSSPIDCDLSAKRINLNKSVEENFTLKRQRCIRRRRLDEDRKVSLKTFLEENMATPLLNDESFECTPCYMENKDILQSTYTVDAGSRIRRCLLFEDSSCMSECSVVDVRGTLDLNIYAQDEALFVHIIRCRDLYRPGGKINAYVKVCIKDAGVGGGHRSKKSGSALQRTAVQAESNRPHFNHTFRFPVVKSGDLQKKIHIEVWHRDRTSRTSELLGCMSFDVKNECEKGVSGSYRLLSQSSGRTQHAPITAAAADGNEDGDHDGSRRCNTSRSKMCESQASVEEVVTVDSDSDNDLRRTTNHNLLQEQQREADELLFLRFLELDPTEGPDAIPAATQRKATGNKCGRTPFTQTKKMMKPPTQRSFGFSVVWTHPPRVERVEKGMSADKAGMLPGDYIIFVDKLNVVVMPEIDCLNFIKSFGSQLTLEIFRKNPTRNGSVPSVRRLVSSSTATVTSNANTITSNINLVGSSGGLSQVAPLTTAISNVGRRPSTVCSTNATSVEYNRRKLHLPQVTFTSEKQTNNPEENRKKSMYQLISKEQTYAIAMQFAMTRFVSALAERRDLISQQEHRILFQNSEEILRITEDILDHVVQEDGEPFIHLVLRTYQLKLTEITSAYKRYCGGIKKADCVLAQKMRNVNSEFVRFVQVPAIPKRRPDITTFIHKPLEHYREVLKMLTVIQGCTKPAHDDYPVINQVIHDLQITYREITSDAGLMEPVGSGRPLLSVQDLENRLVFTKCKPFVLNKPGRHWIFGGDLSRVEGRNVRPYWTLLFNDMLLFSKVSRDRVLFLHDEPLPLAHITDMLFNVKKKDNEFRITISPEGKLASSPTVHCGPDLSRTPRKNSNKRTVILRAPTSELKAVWQNLLQRQIFHINSGMDGSSYSSPLESPDAPITSSVQSAESLSQRQTGQNVNQNQSTSREIQRQIDVLIELKCKQLSKTSFNSKCNAIHLEKWMKGELDGEVMAAATELEPLAEEWTEEMLRKRSQELRLVDREGNLTNCTDSNRNRCETRCEDYCVSSEHSPSKSTTSESQVTVRSSPLVPENVQFCRQCHKNCLTNGNATAKHPPQQPQQQQQEDPNDWQPLLLFGLCGGANPAASLVNMDPFAAQVPKISVVPATPESSIKTASDKQRDEVPCHPCQCQNKPQINNIDLSSSHELDMSPDDSPQTEEHPYRSLSSSVATLRRFGTVSSLERVGSEEREDTNENNLSSDSEDEHHNYQGIDNEAFNHNSSSVLSWTARAGSFVAEKIAIFEDYRTGGRFFERYLKTSDNPVNGDDGQEEETSGATSGEEIWGTPTSGGDLDDSLTSPNYEGKQSPNDGSVSSDNGDDTELMMDELLMTPPMTGALIRGLLPRRTLEPLIEEDCSETSSSSSDLTSPTEPSLSPEQGSGIGDVADTCSTAADVPSHRPRAGRGAPTPAPSSTDSPLPPTTSSPPTPAAVPPAAAETPPKTKEEAEAARLCRAESYRRIIEAVEDGTAVGEDVVVDADAMCFFNRFRPTMKFANIERVPRNKSIRIFEFFNMRRERRIYETYPQESHLLKMLNKEEPSAQDDPEKPLSPRRLEDKRLDRRFWKQLSRRRGNKGNQPA